MPKINAYSRDNIQNSLGILDLHISWLNQSVTTTSNPTFQSLSTSGDMIIGGNLIVHGTSTIVSSEIVELQDNIITINAEETGAGVTLNLAGIEIDRGTLSNFQAVYQESTGLYKIGNIGLLQAVATREDSPLNKGIMVYDTITDRLNSVTTIELPIVFSSGINSTSSSSGTITINGGIGITGDIYTDSKLYIKGNDYSNYINSDSSNQLIVNSGTNFKFQQNTGSQIIIPTGVLLTLSSVSQRITSDGSTVDIINLDGNIKLTTNASGSVLLPINTYLQWTSTNRIRYNGSNIVLDTDGNFTINSSVNINSNVSSSSTTTGSLILNGGIGINNNTDATSSSNGGTFTTLGGMAIKKSMFIGNTLNIGDTNLSIVQVSGQGINYRSLNRILNTSSTNDTVFNSFEGGIINKSLGTINNASTVYISGPPTITGGAILTNSYSLNINSGISKFDSIILTNTTASNSSITGSLTTLGGISISNTTDSSSSSNGGTFTTDGGAAIAKSMYVGKKLDIGDTSITGSHISMQGINFRSRNRNITTSSSDNLMINTFEGGNIVSNNIISEASTLYISGSPSITGSGSITSSYSLYINSGTTRIDGTVLFTNNTASTSSITGSLHIDGGIGISNNTDAISEDNGGSLTIGGGVGIKKKLYVGKEITSNNGTNNAHFRLFQGGLSRFTLGLNNNETGLNTGSDFVISRYTDLGNYIENVLNIERTTGNITINTSTNSTSSNIGSLILNGGISISNTTNANSSVNGGSFTSAGGASIAKDTYIGGNLDINGITTLNQTTIDTTNGDLTINGTNGLNISVGDTSIIKTTTGSLTIKADTGTVIINGDTGMTLDSNAGISIDAKAASNLSTSIGIMTIAGIGLNMNGSTGEIDISTSSTMNLNSGTGGLNINTTDTTLGLKIGTNNSGVPITIGNSTSDVIIGDNLIVNGNLTVLGSRTEVESNIITINDNMIVVNSGLSGLYDGGYLIRRYQIPNNTNSGEVITDTPKETSTFNIGSSLPATLVLNSTSNNTNNYYNGWWIKITTGTGSGQVRRIKSYNGTTKTATIYSITDNTGIFLDGLNLINAPALSDTYELFNNSYAGIYYNENVDEIKFAYIADDINPSTLDTPLTYLPIHAKSIITEEGFVTNGDMTINGILTVDYNNINTFVVRKSGGTGDVFKVDTTNSNIYLSNPINTVNSDITLLFQQKDSLNSIQTYSQINSVIRNNTSGNLRNDLIFSVQKDTSGLSTYITLIGDTTGSGYVDYSTNVDSVRILNTTASSSSSTGVLRSSGGISISNTTDAISSSNGGTFTTAGGIAVAKKIYGGESLTISGTNQVIDTDNLISGTEGNINTQGDIILYNSTKNTILFNNNGIEIPSYTNRSIGSKLVLSPNVSGSTVDYAIGIESNAIWYSASDLTSSHKFYLGTNEEVIINNIGLNIQQPNSGIHFYNGTNTASIYENGGVLRITPHTDSITEGIIFRDTSDTITRIRINSDGKLSLGLSNYSGIPSSSGSFFNINSVTFTDSFTNSSNVTSIMSFNTIEQPTLSSINTNVTTTDVINTYINGAPIKGTNENFTNAYGLYIGQGTNLCSSGTISNASSLYIQGAPLGTTITNSYAMWIDSGLSRFDGQVNITNNSVVSSTDNNITGVEGALNLNGDLTFYNSTKNTIIYSQVGVGIPTLTNRSVGTKLVLYPIIDSSYTDYAIGMEDSAIWYSVPSSLHSHNFYLGISKRVQIDDTGLLIDTGISNTYTIRLNTTNGSDSKGIILKGGNDGDHTRGAQLQLYGNELNTGNAILSAGDSGSLNLQTGSSTNRLTILNTGQINISSTEDTTGTGTGGLRISGGLSVNKTTFIGSDSGSFLALDFNQRYDFSGNSSGNLNIQSKVTSIGHKQRHFTNDGDNTDSNTIEIYGLGTPNSVTNSEFIKIGFEPTSYNIKTQSTGTGTSRDLNIETGSNIGQLKLLNTGQISLSSTEASTSSSNGAIRLSGGISINNSTNSINAGNGGTFTTTGGAAIAQDLYVGGNLYVTGTGGGGIFYLASSVNTPTITVSDLINITGSVTVNTNKLIAIGTQRELTSVFRFTPTNIGILTEFQFTLQDVTTNFNNIYDVIVSSNGYRNDTDPINLENVIGYAVIGTKLCKIRFTSGGTDIHSIQVIVRYTV